LSTLSVYLTIKCTKLFLQISTHISMWKYNTDIGILPLSVCLSHSATVLELLYVLSLFFTTW